MHVGLDVGIAQQHFCVLAAFLCASSFLSDRKIDRFVEGNRHYNQGRYSISLILVVVGDVKLHYSPCSSEVERSTVVAKYSIGRWFESGRGDCKAAWRSGSVPGS